MFSVLILLLVFADKTQSSPIEQVSNETSSNGFYKVDQDVDRFSVHNEIFGKFTNKKTFACPIVKSTIHTGDSLANLSPEDISIVAAMGDSLATGKGLWEGTDVEFRGAAFPIGGDANIDGLVTVPNILSQFQKSLNGLSHGMGPVENMPDYQYNVARAGAETEDLPLQSLELIRRIREQEGQNLRDKWVLLTVAIGSEEFCYRCEPPSHTSIRKALGQLRKRIPKLLVVLLGPVHVASSYKQRINLMKPRCSCLRNRTVEEYRSVSEEWKSSFMKIEEEFNNFNHTTFGVLAIPELSIHSRDPDSLFVPNRPLLNRKGHTYAAKWYWNLLMTGPGYNSSLAKFSEDSYYCPSIGCPYFRTVQNLHGCKIRTIEEKKELELIKEETKNVNDLRRDSMRMNLGGFMVLIFFLATCSVCIFGSIFYAHGMKATKGRFDYSKKDDDETEIHEESND